MAINNDGSSDGVLLQRLEMAQRTWSVDITVEMLSYGMDEVRNDNNHGWKHDQVYNKSRYEYL
jgi:hypothetical protein